MIISDWDDAYANGVHIEGADAFPPRWNMAAAAFRAAHPPQTLSYGAHPRLVMDVFYPHSTPKGVALFVHGGYWMAFDRSSWSHLAAGALARGYAVALPSYVLTPECRITDITNQITCAIDRVGGDIPGPIYLAGHSAGGHLVSRMLCEDISLNSAPRIAHVLSISGVHDLRPLLRTSMQAELQLDMAEAVRESAALCTPRAGTRLTAWVGALERPEFIRQAQLLANIWTGLGADCSYVCSENKHHFNVIDELANPNSKMIEHWLG